MDDLEVALKHNLGWWAKGEPGDDYRILAISDSRDQLRDFKKSLAKGISKKEITG